MSEIILYGNVRDRSLRAMAEKYFLTKKDQILFYVDDNVMDISNADDAKKTSSEMAEIWNGLKVPIYSPTRIKDHPGAIVVILCAMGFEKVYNRLRAQGILNEILMAPVLGWRFIMDPYEEPEQYNFNVTTWIVNNKNRLHHIYLHKLMIARMNIRELC